MTFQSRIRVCALGAAAKTSKSYIDVLATARAYEQWLTVADTETRMSALHAAVHGSADCASIMKIAEEYAEWINSPALTPRTVSVRPDVDTEHNTPDDIWGSGPCRTCAHMSGMHGPHGCHIPECPCEHNEKGCTK